MTDLPPYLSLQQFADHIGVPKKTVERWNQRGQGPVSTRLGKYVRISRADLDAWLMARREPADKANGGASATSRRRLA